jgi:cytoskeletal protein RodZ
MYTDQQLRDLVHQNYPQFARIYDNFKHPIERVDFARYCIMHKYGGVYADMDMELIRALPSSWFNLTFNEANTVNSSNHLSQSNSEQTHKTEETSYSSGSNEKNSSDDSSKNSSKSEDSSKDSSKSEESSKSDVTTVYMSVPSEEQEKSKDKTNSHENTSSMNTSKYKIIIGQEPLEHARNIYGRDMVLCNAIMLSVPGHPFWLQLMNFVASNYNRNGSPVHNTGPMAMTMMYERHRDFFDDVKIMPACTFYALTNNNTSIHKGRYKSISASCVNDIDTAYAVHHWTNTWIAPYDATRTFRIQDIHSNVPVITSNTQTNNTQSDNTQTSTFDNRDEHTNINKEIEKHRNNWWWMVIVCILVFLIVVGLIMLLVMYFMRRSK